MTERDKLIEAAARAISASANNPPIIWEEHSDMFRTTCREFAAAAIDSIYSAGLEWPTEEMVKARWSPEEWDAGVPEARVPEWRAMWRASPLAPKEDGK